MDRIRQIPNIFMGEGSRCPAPGHPWLDQEAPFYCIFNLDIFSPQHSDSVTFHPSDGPLDKRCFISRVEAVEEVGSSTCPTRRFSEPIFTHCPVRLNRARKGGPPTPLFFSISSTGAPSPKYFFECFVGNLQDLARMLCGATRRSAAWGVAVPHFVSFLF